MKKMLIATDYDGTLNTENGIDAHTRSAIDKWRDCGRYFGVVTGRGIDFYDTALEVNLPFDYLILYNGSLIISDDKSVLYESLIPAETLATLERTMSRYGDAVYYQKGDGQPKHHYYAEFLCAERALKVREELLPEFGKTLNIFVNGPHINIGNSGTGKSEGVDFILRYFSLPADSAAAVGDDYNDLDMIIAHNGWAVEGGKPDVVSKAPHTCKSVGHLIDSLL